MDDVVTVDDEEIAAAILYALEEMKTTLEGAGAAALAALLFKRPPTRFPAVMVLSGGNINVNFLAQITERGLFRSGRLIRLRRPSSPTCPAPWPRCSSVIARERSNVVSIVHDRLPHDCPPGYSTVELLLETRDRAHGEELVGAASRRGIPDHRLIPNGIGTIAGIVPVSGNTDAVSCSLLLACAAAASATAPRRMRTRSPTCPTPEIVVEAMLSIAEVSAQDNLVDLGSGDGRIVITAARKLRGERRGDRVRPGPGRR